MRFEVRKLGGGSGGFAIEFVDDFVEDVFTSLIAVDF